MEYMKEYIEKNKERFMSELFSLLRIPSVSSSSEHRNDMRRCAERLSELLLEAGADNAAVYETEGHPVVFAEKIIDKKAATVLVYGHYDVQPADPVDLWESDPFEPVIRDGAIYARGADDDKGQLFMHLKAFEYLVKLGKLNHNVKFIFEGEEEIGSPSLAKWAESHKEMLRADDILVSDTTMIDESVPSINCGMRGLAYVEVEVTGPDKDLHSGHYGGAVVNPINALCSMISSLIDENGRITVKGFYDDVIELDPQERAMLAKAPFDESEYKRFLGVDAVRGEKGYTTMERTGIRPCLDVNGIWGGYTGEGAKTVLPSKAYAKVSCRLVPHQDHKKISRLFEEYIKQVTPPYIQVKVTPSHGGEGYVCPINLPAYRAAEQAMTTAFGKMPLAVRRGGSIPIISTFEQVLGIKSILMGFGLEENAIHSPNENFRLDIFRKGIEAVVEFHKEFSK